MLALFASLVVLAPPSLNELVSEPIPPCRDGSSYYCGTLRRSLDPTGIIPGTIDIHFEFLPHRDRSSVALGTIVANEGGPGSGSTESRDTYEALFHPLLDRVDLLLMDNRGTGKSDAIDCEPLQSEPVIKQRDVELCGAHLGARAALYSSALAADDLAAVMDEMHVAKADLYGDSYGTFFSQTFAVRHPDRVRSIVLDGAFPVVGDSPWYPTAARVMRDSYDAVCHRSPPCMDSSGNTSMDRIARLVAAVRAHPFGGTAMIGTTPHTTRVDPSSIAMVMDASGLSVVPYLELDAAARAYLDDQDSAPLVRLVAESYEANESAGPVDAYSRGLFAAVSCEDYPQAYDMSLSPGARYAAWTSALEAEKKRAPDVYAPFTIDEWLAMPPDYSVVGLCVDWPAPPAGSPAGQPIPAGAPFPSVPTLVLSGELDTVTTPDEGDAATDLFPNAEHVVFANSAHVDALDDPYDCASKIALTFIAVLASGDTSCASTIPPLRLIPQFARSISDVAQATATGGNAAGSAELRAAAAAVFTVADALDRELWLSGPDIAGLRGGSAHVTKFGDNSSYDFFRDRWTDDLSVSGLANANSSSGHVGGTLQLSGAVHGTLGIDWNSLDPRSKVTLTGTLDGDTVEATMPTP